MCGIAGILLTAILVARRVPGAIVISIAVITLLGLLVPASGGGHVTRLPTHLLSAPASPAPVFLKLTFHFLTNFHAIALSLPITVGCSNPRLRPTWRVDAWRVRYYFAGPRS